MPVQLPGHTQTVTRSLKVFSHMVGVGVGWVGGSGGGLLGHSSELLLRLIKVFLESGTTASSGLQAYIYLTK